MVWIILIFMILKTYSFKLFQCSYQSYSCQVKRRQILTCSYICKSLRFVLFYGIYIINLFFFFPFIKKKKKTFQFQAWLNFFSLLHQSYYYYYYYYYYFLNAEPLHPCTNIIKIFSLKNKNKIKIFVSRFLKYCFLWLYCRFPKRMDFISMMNSRHGNVVGVAVL